MLKKAGTVAVYIKKELICIVMFYSVAATEDNLELLVLLVLLLNLFVFFTITFMPGAYRNLGDCATRLMDWLLKGNSV